MRKALLLMISAFLLIGAPAWPQGTTAPDATLVSASLSAITGRVILKNMAGKSRKGLIGSKVYQGETVKVGKASTATLLLFDGSAMELQSNTQLVLSILKKTSEKEKNLKFKLDFGQLVAKVKKLLTPTSSFEVEAGGAICGVRGTQYNISYDPGSNKITVTVTEGSVYFNLGGNTYIVHAGESISFTNGQPQKGTSPNPAGNGGSGSSNNSNDGSGSGGDGGGSLGSLGSIPVGDGGALDDLNGQVTSGIITNGNNTVTDPSVGGSVKVNVTSGLPTAEGAP